MGAKVSLLQPATWMLCQGFSSWANSPRWLICYKDDHSQNTSFEQNRLDLISVPQFLSAHLAACPLIPTSVFNSQCPMYLPHTCILCSQQACLIALFFFSSALRSVHSMMLHFNWLLLSCQSLLAVDVVGGASEGTAGWCVCRVSGSSAGPDQAFWPAAADYLAGYCQCHQRGRGPYTTAQVTIINACYTDAQHTLFS